MRLLMIMLVCCVSFQTFAQSDIKPPTEVRKSFILKYPDAAIRNWDLVEDTYRATYNRGGILYYSMYTPKGEWLETWTSVDVVEVPLVVREAIRQSNYSTWPVDNISKVELPRNENVYRYHFTQDGKTQILNVDDTGKIIR